jgi:hypothetical protein
MLTYLIELFGRGGALNLLFGWLWLAFGDLAKSALTFAQEAETHADWTGTQKFDFVKDQLLAKYVKLVDYKWVLNILIELAVGKLKNYGAKLGDVIE